MKICFISAHNFSKPGGVRTHILNLSREMEKLGHETHIIAPKRGLSSTSFNSNIPNLMEIGMSIAVPLNGSSADLSLFTSEAMFDFIDEKEFDILHFHNFLPFISTDALLFAQDTAKVLTIHTLPSGINKHFVTAPGISKLGEFYDHTIFVSESQKGMYEGFLKEFSIIPNGINLKENITPRKQRTDKKFKLLYVGRIEARKGLGYLIEAFDMVLKQLPESELHIVGSGDMDFLRKAYATLIGVENKIIFHGTVSDEELLKIRSEADIYISPAIKGESFGIVLLEAMAEGLPVVAFDNEGYRTVLKGKLADGLVENKNSEKLSQKIIEVLTDKEKYEFLSNEGLQQAKEYTWDKIAKKIESIYQSIA